MWHCAVLLELTFRSQFTTAFSDHQFTVLKVREVLLHIFIPVYGYKLEVKVYALKEYGEGRYRSTHS